MKKQYIKPEQSVVVLQHSTMLLQASGVQSLSVTGLDNEDDINISDTGGGSGIMDR